MLKLGDPVISDGIVDGNDFLFIEMVVTVMVWRDLGCFLDVLEEGDKTWPGDSTGWGIPVLDVMDGVDGDKFLRLRKIWGIRWIRMRRRVIY